MKNAIFALCLSLTLTTSTMARAAIEPAPVLATQISVSFQKDGKEVKNLDFAALEKLVKPSQVTFTEPHELVKKQMTGFDFAALLKKVYGASLKKDAKIVFTCLDGYQPTLPVSAALAGKSYLAFKEEGKNTFQIKKGDTVVYVGPYYLVWDHALEGEKLQVHLAQGHWPYQVKAMNLTTK